MAAALFLAAAIALALSDSARFVAGSMALGCIYGMTSGEDVDQAAALEKAVTSKVTSIHRFVRSSMTLPNEPPIAVTPGSRAILTQPPLITVYEIKDRAEQDRVIAAVQAVLREQNVKRVDLQFMDHENWVT